MFNNANVLFRTKFVDGMSTVLRTVQHHAQEDNDKTNKRKPDNASRNNFFENGTLPNGTRENGQSGATMNGFSNGKGNKHAKAPVDSRKKLHERNEKVVKQNGVANGGLLHDSDDEEMDI